MNEIEVPRSLPTSPAHVLVDYLTNPKMMITALAPLIILAAALRRQPTP
jgi:hypothetical protein